MAWDRFSYTLNNPLKYVDPTGHFTGYACKNMADGYCMDNAASATNFYAIFVGNFTTEQKKEYTNQLKRFAARLAYTTNRDSAALAAKNPDLEATHLKPLEAFLLIFGGPIKLTLLLNEASWAAQVNADGSINIYKPQWASDNSRLILHEVGHIVYNKLRRPSIPSELSRENHDYGLPPTYNGFCGGKSVCQFSLSDQLAYDWEEFADMFLGYSINSWGTYRPGDGENLADARKSYMEKTMYTLITSYLEKPK